MCIVWFLQNGSHLITPDINALHKTSHGRSWSLSCADDQHLNAQHRDVNPFTVQNVCYSTLYWLVHRDPLLWCYVQLNRMTVYHINLYCQLDYQGLITENFKLHTFRSLKISGSWQRWSFFAVVEARDNSEMVWQLKHMICISIRISTWSVGLYSSKFTSWTMRIDVGPA